MFKYPLAVTVDTNVFDAAKYDLSESGVLQILKTYVDKGILKVVLSDIVVRESKRHITKQTKKVCGIARKLRAEALEESTEHLITHIGLDRLLEIPKDKDILIKKSEELFDNFLQEINAEILGTNLINLDGIIDDYFSVNPPFEEGEKKRKEFPDAFIAQQIRSRFGETEDVAIISNDNGFKKACQQTKNHFFFCTLGELFNAINKEKEAAYAETITIIKALQFCIASTVSEYIKSNESIDVRGRSYDKDGVASGFDYTEFFLHEISNMSFKVHSIDEISDKTSKVTLMCTAHISADCYYEDYDNAPWDSELKEFVFVDTVHMREEHDARFGCRIELDREAKSFTLFPFRVILGGDSRKDRYIITEELTVDHEQEIHDMDRDALGFIPFGSYESYLEDNLHDSEFAKEMIEEFEKIGALYRSYEEFCVSYDSLLEILGNPDAHRIIRSIYEKLSEISDVPHIENVESIEASEVERFKDWINLKYEKASEIAEESALPDTINYGKSIVIKGVDGSKMVFVLDEIEISPTEGSEESIKMHLSNHQGEKIGGYIKLTVGYLSFDEDGGASDGIDDNIEYEFHEIMEEIRSFVSEQSELTEKEAAIVEIINTLL